MNTKETLLEQHIARLRTRLLVMCATVGIAVEEACSALVNGNVGQASAVIDGDDAVNALENEIDAMTLSLLVRNQPVAQDLRFVVGALRMVVDLERIGDEAASIAERAIVLHAPLPGPVMEAVTPLITAVGGYYKRAIKAFTEGDGKKALALCRADDEITQMEVHALQRIMDDFCIGSESRSNHGNKSYAGMHGILACRALSRICRRSANIAEHTYFIAEGENIKHAPLPYVKK